MSSGEEDYAAGMDRKVSTAILILWSLFKSVVSHQPCSFLSLQRCERLWLKWFGVSITLKLALSEHSQQHCVCYHCKKPCILSNSSNKLHLLAMNPNPSLWAVYISVRVLYRERNGGPSSSRSPRPGRWTTRSRLSPRAAPPGGTSPTQTCTQPTHSFSSTTWGRHSHSAPM